MDSNLVLDVHLIKFINAADAIVCQHQSTCLNAELIAVCILHQPAQPITHQTSWHTTIFGQVGFLQMMSGCTWR